MNGYFITGTDTGVGKTFVAAALARRARTHGQRVFAFKPIETGCEPGREGPDQGELCAAAGGWQTGRLRGVYALRLPAAPFVAAREEHTSIELSEIAEALAEGARDANLVIVEGAGGWRVPISESADIATLARLTGFPVIVVARAGLGTLNHTLLTLEAVERDGCTPAAVVLSVRPDERSWLVSSNHEELQRLWRGPVVMFDGPESQLDGLLRFT